MRNVQESSPSMELEYLLRRTLLNRTLPILAPLSMMSKTEGMKEALRTIIPCSVFGSAMTKSGLLNGFAKPRPPEHLRKAYRQRMAPCSSRTEPVREDLPRSI